MKLIKIKIKSMKLIKIKIKLIIESLQENFPFYNLK